VLAEKPVVKKVPPPAKPNASAPAGAAGQSAVKR
jgi:hypothetical protein